MGCSPWGCKESDTTKATWRMVQTAAFAHLILTAALHANVTSTLHMRVLRLRKSL